MENSEQQILSEIASVISSMQSKLEQMEAKINELQNLLLSAQTSVEEEALEDMEPIDIMISDDFQILEMEKPLEVPSEEQPEMIEKQTEEPFVVEEDSPESVDAEALAEDLPSGEVAEDLPADETLEEVVVEEAHQEETVSEDLPEDDAPTLLFEMEPAPEKKPEPKPRAEKKTILLQKAAENARTSMLDTMVSKQAWRHDVPGAPVKDVIGAIALVDRVLFINSLFEGNPSAFQNTLAQINQMGSLDEAVGYLSANYPDWDMDSDVVYRFMMAVRRKVNE